MMAAHLLECLPRPLTLSTHQDHADPSQPPSFSRVVCWAFQDLSGAIQTFQDCGVRDVIIVTRRNGAAPYVRPELCAFVRGAFTTLPSTQPPSRSRSTRYLTSWGLNRAVSVGNVGHLSTANAIGDITQISESGVY